MKKLAVLFAFVLLVSFGCQQRAVTQPESEKMGQAETGKPSGEQGKVSEQKVATVESKEIPSKAMEEQEGLFKDVLFDFDKYDIKDTYKPLLQSVYSWMMKNTGAKLSVEGHCDERGTNEYNLALGDRRAKAVKDYLVSLGVPSSRVETISYGEEKPACTEHNEDCWTKNRRGHLVVLTKAGK